MFLWNCLYTGHRTPNLAYTAYIFGILGVSLTVKCADLAGLDLDMLAEFAAGLAQEARPLSRRWFRTYTLDIDRKRDASPVTRADREVEHFLRHRISERFPDHGLFGEEHGTERADATVTWIIDPIDGTRSFITGWPIYGMLLAVLINGQPVLGQIDMPALGERWIGCQSRPTLFNGDLVRTSGCRRLADASAYTTSPDSFAADDWINFERVTRLARERRFGGDCYSYALLASGHIDLVIEAGLQPYDYLPLVPVVDGAGGIITDWAGRPLTRQSDGRVIAAATIELHAEAIAALQASA